MTVKYHLRDALDVPFEVLPGCECEFRNSVGVARIDGLSIGGEPIDDVGGL